MSLEKRNRGNPSGTPVHPALVSSPETLDVAGEARRETRAKQAKPVGFEPPRSLGETRAKQGGSRDPRATQRKLLVTGNPAAGIVFKILRKPTRHLDRVQTRLWPSGSVASWGASLCITLYIVAIRAKHSSSSPSSRLLIFCLFSLPNMRPSCGIRTHDLGLLSGCLLEAHGYIEKLSLLGPYVCSHHV